MEYGGSSPSGSTRIYRNSAGTVTGRSAKSFLTGSTPVYSSKIRNWRGGGIGNAGTCKVTRYTFKSCLRLQFVSLMPVWCNGSTRASKTFSLDSISGAGANKWKVKQPGCCRGLLSLGCWNMHGSRNLCFPPDLMENEPDRRAGTALKADCPWNTGLGSRPTFSALKS